MDDDDDMIKRKKKKNKKKNKRKKKNENVDTRDFQPMMMIIMYIFKIRNCSYINI